MRVIGINPKSLRSVPSQANPSILIGQRVDTEDDILHIRDLPDFDGTLGARDSELLLQYLLAPYLRIPLLLNFFSSEARIKALRCSDLQEVLDAAMFEPGQFKESSGTVLPESIPSLDRNHLCTPVGLLFNEILLAPNVVLAAIQQMLEKSLEMDSGKYSELGQAILFIVRLAIRVEGYLLFLVKSNQFHKDQRNNIGNVLKYHGAYTQALVRGLDECDDVLGEALVCQKNIRNMLEDRVFKIIARWIKKSKQEGKMAQACMLHAHLAFIYRNVEEEDLNARVIFTILASQIFSPIITNLILMSLFKLIRKEKTKKKSITI